MADPDSEDALVAEPEPLSRFRDIYEANYTRILGYALRRTDTADDAADVVADTFLAAWRRIDEIPQGEEARLWLYGVARRVLANHRRGQVRKARLADRLRLDLARMDFVQPPPGFEELERFSAAFGALRPKDRELLSLTAWEGLRIEDLSKILGCSSNAAKIRLHRARRRLARELERVGARAKPPTAVGHMEIGRASARPDTEEAH